MTRKQKETLLFFAGIVLVFILVFLIFLTVKKRLNDSAAEKAQAEEDASYLTKDRQFTSLTYTNKDATLSFAQNEDGAWYWVDDPEFPLNDSTIKTVAYVAANLKPTQTITNGDTLEAYGLANPTCTLTATAEDGTKLELAIGNTISEEDGYYLLMNQDESTVYIVKNSLNSRLTDSIYSMMKLPELPPLTEETLLSVMVRGPQTATVLTAQHAEASGEDAVGDTTWRSGGANVTDDPSVQALISELAQLKLTRCVDYRPSAEAVSICGFDEPSAVLSVSYLTETGAEETFTLSVGLEMPSQNEEDAGDYFVQINGESTLYEMDDALISTLMELAAAGLDA